MYMDVLPACMTMYHMHAVPLKIRRECWIPWKWSYEPPCGCWDSFLVF